MRWAPVVVMVLGIVAAACRGSGEGVVDAAGSATPGASATTAADGASLASAPAGAHGTGKKIAIMFTANVIGELEPCG